jgi:Spy/CpxP family protein refolding chaperone
MPAPGHGTFAASGTCPQGAMSPGEGRLTIMHPGMFAWWNARRRAAYGDFESAGCGPRGCGAQGHGGDEGPPSWAGWRGHGGHEGHAGGHHGGPGGGDEFGGGFGVRRPLRFLAFKLDLSEAQVTDLAAILSELKTERAQAAVDQRRTTSSLADAVAAEAFDEAKVKSAAQDRVRSSERVQAAVARALSQIHALLKPEQRAKLAYLLRTGALSI